MTPPDPFTITYLLDKAWVLLLGLFWHNKKRLETDNKARDAKIELLQTSMVTVTAASVTEVRMKEAINESLEHYKEDQQEIKNLLTSLNDSVNAISLDIAIQAALKDAKEK